MKTDRRTLVRIIAIALAVLLAGLVLAGAVISFAYAQETDTSQNHMTLDMEFLEGAQALRIKQRLVYYNTSGFELDRLIFYIPANLLRRLDSLPYEGEELVSAMPEGYLPGGVDLTGVRVDGEPAEYGFQGENEMYLRVACSLAPGQSARFDFDYYLLLSDNAAFLGLSDTGWRLSGFYFAPATLDAAGEFILNPPLSFTAYIDTPVMDVEANITLPGNWNLAATGEEAITEVDPADMVVTGEAQSQSKAYDASVDFTAVDSGASADLPSVRKGGVEPSAGADSDGWDERRWRVKAEGVRDFALSFGKRWRVYARVPEGGVGLRCLTNVRGVGDGLMDVAAKAVAACEAWFGPFPCGQLDFVQADIAGGSLANAGCLWLSAELLRDDAARDHAVRVFVARQYFGGNVSGRPVTDAWLTDALCEYIAYLLLEEAEGHDAFLRMLNQNVVPSLQLTLPGGLNVNSEASLFTSSEYQIVVRDRGAAVFHELRHAMGRDELIEGLRAFYEQGAGGGYLTEMDLVRALDEASGGDWQAFLTDYIYNIDEYTGQSIDWLD